MSKTIREAIDNYSGNTTHSKTIREAIDNAAGHKGLMYQDVKCMTCTLNATEEFCKFLTQGQLVPTSISEMTIRELVGTGTLIDVISPLVKVGDLRFSLFNISHILFTQPGAELYSRTSVRGFIDSVNNSQNLDNAKIVGFEGFGICSGPISQSTSFTVNAYFKILK